MHAYSSVEPRSPRSRGRYSVGLPAKNPSNSINCISNARAIPLAYIRVCGNPSVLGHPSPLQIWDSSSAPFFEPLHSLVRCRLLLELTRVHYLWKWWTQHRELSKDVDQVLISFVEDKWRNHGKRDFKISRKPTLTPKLKSIGFISNTYINCSILFYFVVIKNFLNHMFHLNSLCSIW